MDKIRKALKKFSESEQNIIRNLLLQIAKGQYHNLDIKKLKGYDNIFRIRKDKIRIIFHNKNNDINILTIEKRKDTTYNI